MSCNIPRWVAGLICVAWAGLASAEPVEAAAWQPEELALLRLDNTGPWKLAAATPLSATMNTEVGLVESGKAWARVSRHDGLWLVEIGCGNYDFAFRFMAPMGSNDGLGEAPVERCSGSWFKALVGPGASNLPEDPFPELAPKTPTPGGESDRPR